MRIFFSGRRIFGIRPGVSFGREDLRYLPEKAPRILLPFWTNVVFLAAWIGLSAWAVLSMEPGAYLLASQVVAVMFFALVVGLPWAFVTIICAIMRMGQR